MGVDLSALLSMDEPTAQEKAQALASALRRKQAVGTLASLIGGPAQGFGQTLTRQADTGLQALGELPGQRLQLALNKQRLAAGEADAEQKALERGYQSNPNGATAQTATALLSKFMPKNRLPQGTSAGEIMGLLPLAEKAYGVDENSRNRAAALAWKKQGGADVQNGLTPEALDMLAEQFATTGQLPALGMGKDAAAIRLKIASRAAEMHPTANLAANRAGFGADSTSLKKLQTQADAINAFERTALANLDTFLGEAKKVVDVGSPWFNKPARELAKGLAGSPNAAAFEASRQVAVQEISKVLSGQMGNAAVSDSARHEAAGLLSPDASLAQLTRAAEILKQDMLNRKAAMAAELSDVRGRVGGGGNAPAAAPIPSVSGKVRVTNGKETLEIDPGDVAEAERDGFRRAP